MGTWNGTVPPLAAAALETPKISTGVASGRISTAISNPPRLMPGRERGAIAPSIVSAGVPARSDKEIPARDAGSIARVNPSRGEAMTSGKAVAIQWAAHLTRTTSSSGVDAVSSKSSEPSSASD